MSKKIHFVLIGKPSAGKGTAGQLIGKMFDLVEVSTGDALRDIGHTNSELGKKVHEIIDRGDFVSDELITEILKHKLESVKKGIILDGYPRDLEQAKVLESFFNIDHVVLFDAKDETVIERITGRRICPKCKKIYHVVTIKPKVEGMCDICNVPLETREDDTKEIMVERLENYRNKTEPIINFYKEKGLLRVFDANRPFPDLKEDLIAFFKDLIDNTIKE